MWDDWNDVEQAQAQADREWQERQREPQRPRLAVRPPRDPGNATDAAPGPSWTPPGPPVIDDERARTLLERLRRFGR